MIKVQKSEHKDQLLLLVDQMALLHPLTNEVTDQIEQLTYEYNKSDREIIYRQHLEWEQRNNKYRLAISQMVTPS